MGWGEGGRLWSCWLGLVRTSIALEVCWDFFHQDQSQLGPECCDSILCIEASPTVLTSGSTSGLWVCITIGSSCHTLLIFWVFLSLQFLASLLLVLLIP